MLLIVHGGAGHRKPKKNSLLILAEALAAGHAVLVNGGTALDAVVAAVTTLEDSGVFNAGLGGSVQFDGKQRLDASVMEGRDLRAGAVINLEGRRNPVQAARLVMDTPHVTFTNIGGRRIARGLPRLPRPDPHLVERLEKFRKKEKRVNALYEQWFSTVGAVALDEEGNLAAATSTGGTAAMLPGRVGDSPIIGAGTYADNGLGAVSCTGTGEQILRLAMAKEIAMNLGRMAPGSAVRHSLKRLMTINGQGGCIVIASDGRPVIMHTTAYMAAGYAKKGSIVVKPGFTTVG